MENTSTCNNKRSANSGIWGRLGYLAFLLLSLYFVFIQDYATAVSQMGIALIFDPFDEKTPFSRRPWWQQTWLIVHLVVTLVLFVLMFTVL